MADESIKIADLPPLDGQSPGGWSRPTATLKWGADGVLMQQFETSTRGYEWRPVPRDEITLVEQPPMTPEQCQAAEEDAAVDALAAAMKEKLAKKRASGWSGGFKGDDVTADELARGLRHHVGKGDPVDVANYCAMLHARGVGIEKAPNASERAAAILAHIKGHCSPTRRPGSHDVHGATLWQDSEPFVLAILAKALSE